MMNTVLEKKAQELAARPYAVRVFVDETTTGEQVYVALHPELPGCVAQGQTRAEAIENLADARQKYLLSLLEAGLSVPEPSKYVRKARHNWHTRFFQ